MSKLRVFQNLLPVIKNSPHEERIAFAAHKIVRGAEMVKHHFIKTSDDEHSRIIYHRTERFFQSNPAYRPSASNSFSYPCEMFHLDTFRIFGLTKSSRNTETVKAIIAEGTRLGLWVHFPAAHNAGKTGNKANHQAARIVLSGDWHESRIIHHDFKTSKPLETFMNKFKDEQLKLKYQASTDAILSAHNDFVKKCTLPGEDELHVEAKRLVAAGHKTKMGQPYFYGEPNGSTRLDICTPIKLFLLTDFDEAPELDHNEDEEGKQYSTRRTTTFSLTPKWIRHLIKMKKERIVGIDATALHPAIIGMICRQHGVTCPFLSGDSHSKVAELLKITREEAKLINLTYWNRVKHSYDDTTPTGKLLKSFHEVMVRDHKDVLNVLEKENAKYRFVDKDGEVVRSHARLSRVLFMWESIILGDVIKELQAEGIICDSCYDCIYVAESKRDIAAKAFNMALSKYSVDTEAK